MSIPRCSLAVWNNHYVAAEAFRNIACWEWMSDADVFGVKDPDSGETGYCCVLGALGEVHGLVVYLGRAGLEQHRKIQSGKVRAGSPDFAYSQSCLTAWFGHRGELDSTDLKVVKDLDLKFRGHDVWPQFRSLQPGYVPWYLSENEARFLTLCLEQACQVAAYVEKDPGWLIARGKDLYLVRVPSETGDPQSLPNPRIPKLAQDQQMLFPETFETYVRQWNSEWLKPAPLVEATVQPHPLDEIRLQRIRKTSQRHHGIWEMDAFYAPTPVDEGSRPYFPYTVLWADQVSGFIFGSILAAPSTWITEFPKSFLDNVEEHRLLPNELYLKKEELRKLFQPLCTHLGIEVKLTKKLPAVDRAKRGLLRFMGRGR